MGLMTLEQFRQDLAVELGGRINEQSRLTRYVNFGLQWLASHKEVPMADEVRTEANFPVVEDDNTYALPTGFVAMISLEVNGIRLRKLRRQPVATDPIATGTPTHWSQEGSNIVLWPTPDEDYDGVIKFTKEPTALTASADLSPFPAFYDAAIFDFAVYRGLLSLGEKDLALIRLNTAESYLKQRVDKFTLEADTPRSQGLRPVFDWDDLSDDPADV